MVLYKPAYLLANPQLEPESELEPNRRAARSVTTSLLGIQAKAASDVRHRHHRVGQEPEEYLAIEHIGVGSGSDSQLGTTSHAEALPIQVTQVQCGTKHGLIVARKVDAGLGSEPE